MEEGLKGVIDKKTIIDFLNLNYATILYYGKGSSIPAGRFIVKDIETDEIPKDYNGLIEESDTKRIVLCNTNDEKAEITIPYMEFIKKVMPAAYFNTDRIDIGSNFSREINEIIMSIGEKLSEGKSPEELKNYELQDMSLEEINSKYFSNGEEIGNNYSLCAFDLGLYREKVREHIETKKEEDREI